MLYINLDPEAKANIDTRNLHILILINMRTESKKLCCTSSGDSMAATGQGAEYAKGYSTQRHFIQASWCVLLEWSFGPEMYMTHVCAGR